MINFYISISSHDLEDEFLKEVKTVEGSDEGVIDTLEKLAEKHHIVCDEDSDEDDGCYDEEGGVSSHVNGEHFLEYIQTVESDLEDSLNDLVDAINKAKHKEKVLVSIDIDAE